MHLSRSLAAALVLVSPALGQTTWYVDATAAGPGSGTVLDPFASIQFAIDQGSTVDGDTVLVLPGIYAESVDFSGKTLVVRSQDGQAATFLEPQGGPGVLAQSGEGMGTRFEGFTVRDAQQNSGVVLGAGLLLDGSTIEVVDCTIRDCGLPFAWTPEGGAVGARNSVLTMTGCTLLGNYGERAGAVYLDNSTATLTDCWVSSNGSESGSWGAPGLWATLSDVEINNSTFYANGGEYVEAAIHLRDCDSVLNGTVISATQNTGGVGSLSIWRGTAMLDSCELLFGISYDIGHVYLFDADVTVTNSLFQDGIGGAPFEHGGVYQNGGATTFAGCTFDRNRAGIAGAYGLGEGTAHFTDCVFTDNESLVGEVGPQAAALLVEPGASAIVERSFFRGNHAKTSGAGADGAVVSGDVQLIHCTLTGNVLDSGTGVVEAGTLDHCIVWNNTGMGQVPALSPTSTAGWSNIEGGAAGPGNLDSNPMLDVDQTLLAGSPCIDAGDPGLPFGTDGSPVEMGADAWEWPALGSPYCNAQPNSTGLASQTLAFGSGIAGSGPLYLLASELPAQQFTMFLTSQVQDAVVLSGGVGILCLGSPIGRFRSQVQLSGLDGRAAIGVDTSAMPLSPTVAIQSGETWYFQTWHRDVPATSGFSLPVAVMFP